MQIKPTKRYHYTAIKWLKKRKEVRKEGKKGKKGARKASETEENEGNTKTAFLQLEGKRKSNNTITPGGSSWSGGRGRPLPAVRGCRAQRGPSPSNPLPSLP